MQRAARVWRVPFGVGLGYGLVAGLVGVAQWVLTLRDLAERMAAFIAVEEHQTGDLGFWIRIYWDVVANGNTQFWFGTASLAAVVMLGLCWRAAFTASRTSQRPRAGELAALVAAVVSGAIYAAATPLAIANSPDPHITQSDVPAEPWLGILFFIAAIFLARAGAGKGTRTGVLLSRGRRAE